MRETIRYWLRFLWETAKIALWAVLLIGIIFLARVDFSQMNLSPYLLPAIITASAALPQMICGPGAYTLYMPLQLAMGETRRNVFWGYLASILVYALPPAGICGALLALSPGVPNRLGLTLGLLLVQLLSGAFSRGAVRQIQDHRLLYHRRSLRLRRRRLRDHQHAEHIL